MNHVIMPDSSLDFLNPKQREAVDYFGGPLLILAGAGTGKTKVLTTRIAHIIQTQRALPHEILAVTFTNKAANEMRERILPFVSGTNAMWMGTFHSIGLRILRRHCEAVGLRSNFTVLDADDQLRLVKQIIKASGLDEKRHPPKVALNSINLLKDRAISPLTTDLRSYRDPKTNRFISAWIVDTYIAYQQRLQILNGVDFGDLLLHCITLFQQCGDILERYNQQFKFILIDEYQDTNVAQYLWLRLMSQGGAQVCCVGDDDQSIYGWRGAEVDNILRFEQDFQGAKVVRLEQNYRSTSHILGAASGLISHNKGRLGKELWTEVDGGEKVDIRCVYDSEEEAITTVGALERLYKSGYPLNETAILVRASHQTREFEERLIVCGLPYRVIGGMRFYERQEIRDALAYLRLVNQVNDSLAFERIINTPRRGIGESSLNIMHNVARSQGVSLFDAANQLIETDELRTQARTVLRGFLEDVRRWQRKAQELPPAELAQVVLDESGYTAFWKNETTPDAPARLENLKELVVALEEFSTLEGFLEHVSLVMEVTQKDLGPQITIMTLHSAKGLEFGTVFLPGWEEGMFPNQRALEESGTDGLEEERRLAYVGITRAKEKAVITYATMRRMYNQIQHNLPSRFLSELPESHVIWHNRLQRHQPFQTMRRSGNSYKEKPNQSSQAFGDFDFNQEMSGMRHTGMKLVYHKKFGMGKVVRLEGDKADVHFEEFGLKKVLNSFLTEV
ncbi:MAG: UvrD-helicase domain-containing protein [Candidatus Paracaedibacteraceae bacterium]|nr:UvrD-helicase domain-containing protein [Candidatus Paracaedibacteraceae bacterium]